MPSIVKLTKRVVDATVCSQRRQIIWDNELRGFGLRVEASGTKTYLVRYRPREFGAKSPKRFMVIGRHGPLTPEDARQRARQILADVAAGKDPALERDQARKALTVDELANAFIAEHVEPKRKPRTAKGYAKLLKQRISSSLGARKAERITTADVAKIHLGMRAHPYQANRMLAVVGSMYSFGARRGLVPKGHNPASGIEKFKESRRERFLTSDELRRLGDALNVAETTGLPWELDPAAPVSKHLAKEPNQRTILPRSATMAIRLLLFTGARLREVLHLQWTHVDFERGLLLLPDSKTGRKTIVLNRPSLDLLKATVRQGQFVFPGADPDRPRSDLKKPWRSIQRYARLEGVRIHDLRHTFASIGAGSSLGLPIVGKLLGHTQAATTARYAHLDIDPLRRGAELIGEQLSRAMEL